MKTDYKIPPKILNNIPPYFYAAFAGELCSIFGHKIFEKLGDNLYGLFSVECTVGWMAAFQSVTKRLGLLWLSDYYHSLTWSDSDSFDAQIGDMLVKKFMEIDLEENNEYYDWLVET